MLDPLPTLKCYIVRREAPNARPKGLTQYLITNGIMMGRWTLMFGSPCLADSGDCIEFARRVHADTPGSELIEYEIRPVS